MVQRGGFNDLMKRWVGEDDTKKIDWDGWVVGDHDGLSTPRQIKVPASCTCLRVYGSIHLAQT